MDYRNILATGFLLLCGCLNTDVDDEQFDAGIYLPVSSNSSARSMEVFEDGSTSNIYFELDNPFLDKISFSDFTTCYYSQEDLSFEASCYTTRPNDTTTGWHFECDLVNHIFPNQDPCYNYEGVLVGNVVIVETSGEILSDGFTAFTDFTVSGGLNTTDISAQLQ
jgi:hypothetical protein